MAVIKVCDICGEKIKPLEPWSTYRMWRKGNKWHVSGWIKIDVHDWCYEKLLEAIAKESEDE